MRIVRPPTILSLALSLLLGGAALGDASAVYAEGTCTAPNALGFERLDPGDEDSGIGGTGALPQRRARVSDDEESGIGGTGFRPPSADEDDSGLGGTGLFGRLSKVTPPIPADSDRGSKGPGASSPGKAGRACLNGVEIVIPASLNVEASDGATSARSIAAGQLAYVEATRTDAGIVANRLLLDAERAGQIEVIGKDGRRLTVSGEKVQLAPDVVGGRGVNLRALEAGDWIRFQARPGADGTLRVTRIDAGTPPLIGRGDPNFEDRVARLLRGRVKSRRAGEDFYVSIEGVLRGNAERPEILGMNVSLRGTASGEVRSALRAGSRVRIGGRLASDGRIDVAGPPNWLAVPRDARPLRRSDPPTSGPTPETKPSTPTRTPDTKPNPPRIRKPVKPDTPIKPPVRIKPAPVRPDVLRPVPSRDLPRR